MRESIGQSFLVTLAVTLVGIIIIILLCAVAYSKTFKIKSKLIDILEKYDQYEDVYAAASGEMESYLLSIGYRRNRNGVSNCPSESPNGTYLGEAINSDFSQFHYCVYEFDSGVGENRGKYYGVLVYIYFDFPIIGDFIEIPIYGETKVFFDSGYIEG